jgi:SAM-dependent methyltransferase
MGVREAYDRVAEDYAALLADLLAASPYDRAVLGAFAEMVGDRGLVADVGCGPGRITGHLHELGLDVVGIDLSPGMLAVARRAHPHLAFGLGSLTALGVGDGTLAGVVAWYSIIHTPPAELPLVFAELHRVLAPGGRLVLAFQAGDERVHIEHAYGHDVSVDAYRLPPERIADLVTAAGGVVDAQLVRAPTADEKRPQAYLLAHRP